MKTIRKCMTCIVLSVVIVGLVGSSFLVSAYETFDDHRFYQGIQGVSCKNTIDSTTYNAVYTGVNQAIADWDWHLGLLNDRYGVNWNLVTMSGMARAMIEFDIIESENNFLYIPPDHSYAMTTFYDRDNELLALSQLGTTDWYYTTITFAKDTLTAAGHITNVDAMRSIANHEIGHSLGLAHEGDDFGVIMYTPYEVRTANVPTWDDLQGVYHIYTERD